jgi:hypothetical protein
MRILLAGIVGGIVMFFWSFVAHDLTPLGTVGVNTLPNESITVSNIASVIGEKSGLYLFPLDMKRAAAASTGASGFLVFNAHAPLTMAPRNLIIEFLTEVVESILAAWLLAQTTLAGYALRVAFVTVVGLVAAITTNIPYWNWYRFPTNYTLADSLIELIAFFVAGLAIAALVKPKASTA